MKNHRGFRYALQPALVTRQWRLDNLKLDLAKAEESLAQFELKREAVILQKVGAEQDWNVATSQSAQMGIDRLTNTQAYLVDLRQKLAQLDHGIAKARTQRDDLRDELAGVFKEVEGFREHKENSISDYLATLADAEFKRADDQWIMQRGNGAHRDS